MIEKHRNTLLYALLCVAVAVLMLDRVAHDNYLYWTYWWYDIMMHFLGGFLVAGIALWVFVRFSRADIRDARHGLWVAIFTGIVVGLGWEYFEYLSGALIQEGIDLVVDTALDIVMDILGAGAVWLILSKTFFGNTNASTPHV